MKDRLSYDDVGPLREPDPIEADEREQAELLKAQEEEATIRFKAHVWKVGTLGTGGLRVILNLDQEYIRQMAMLAECQHNLIELEFEARQAD